MRTKAFIAIASLLLALMTGGFAVAGSLDDNSLLNFRYGITSTPREINYSDNVTSDIQNQIDNILNSPSVLGDLTISGGVANAPVFILSSPRWEDETLPGTVGKPGANAPDFEVGGGSPLAGMGNSVGVYCFDKNTDQELYFDTKLHHAYKEESNLQIEAHWFPVDSGAGTVQWVAEWDWINVDSAFPSASSFFNVGAAASGTAFQHQHIDINGDLDGTGKVLGSAITIHFFRDANATHGPDTYDDDACLIQLVIHYQVDTPGGSENVHSK